MSGAPPGPGGRGRGGAASLEALKAKNRRPGEETPATSDGAEEAPPIKCARLGETAEKPADDAAAAVPGDTSNEEALLQRTLAMIMGTTEGEEAAPAARAPTRDLASMTVEEQIAYAMQMSAAKNLASMTEAEQIAYAMQMSMANLPGDNTATKEESMEVDDKDADYSEVMNDPAFLQSVLQNLPRKVDDMYMENLEEWILEENKIVTYKYLSRSLKCHVNVAKQMLFNFFEEQQKKGVSLGVVYLLSGFMKPHEDAVRRMKVCLVKQSDLKKATSKFDTITSKHIYSLSKTEESVNPTALYATDYAAFKEDVFSGNALTAVKNKMAVPRSAEAVRKPPPPVAMVKQEAAKVKTEVKPKPKSGIESAFAKAKKSPENKEVKKEEPVKKAAGGSGKKPGGIANFFAKQGSKPLAEKKEVEKKSEGDEKEQIGSDTSPGKENIVNQNIEQRKEDEDKAKDSEPEKKKEVAKTVMNEKKSNKKKNSRDSDDSKKRKRIQVMSDSDESEDEKEEPVEVMEEEVAPPQAALIESDDDEIIPGTPKVEKKSKPGRKRVKKLIDKTFMDDKGYMVTKKVYESGSETDNEPSPVKNPVKPVKKDYPPAPAAKKAKMMAPGNKQQGIMSFFKKK